MLRIASMIEGFRWDRERRKEQGVPAERELYAELLALRAENDHLTQELAMVLGTLSDAQALICAYRENDRKARGIGPYCDTRPRKIKASAGWVPKEEASGD